MSGAIYLRRDDGTYVPMNEEPYASEDVLQKLIEEFPDILAGDQMGSDAPRRWILVAREMGVPGQDAGANRFSADHLFLDQDAIPTIVEVKRSSNTQIRREVVGQMLDYAANGVVYWPIDKIRSRFEARCDVQGVDPDETLRETLSLETDQEHYWATVAINLRAGNVRMVFVADKIPAELQRVVEFLNSQMRPAQVFAVEVRQYVGQNMKTLVPRVIGHLPSPADDQPITSTEEAFFSALSGACKPAEVQAFRRLYNFTKMRGAGFSWGTGKHPAVGGRFRVEDRVVTVWVGHANPQNPKLAFGFSYMRSGGVALQLLKAFAERLRAVPGLASELATLEDVGFKKEPRVSARILAQPNVIAAVESAIEHLTIVGTRESESAASGLSSVEGVESEAEYPHQ